MERRKFTIGLGALVTGSAAAMGTGAFNVARADREIEVATTGDESAYLGLDATSEYASGTSDGQLAVTLDELGEDSNYVFNDVFQITNNGQDNIIVDLATDTDNIEWDTEYPRAYWSDDEQGTTQFTGRFDNEFNDNRPVIGPGESVYVHFEFIGREAELDNGHDDAPEVIGVYAEATDSEADTSE